MNNMKVEGAITDNIYKIVNNEITKYGPECVDLAEGSDGEG